MCVCVRAHVSAATRYFWRRAECRISAFPPAGGAAERGVWTRAAASSTAPLELLTSSQLSERGVDSRLFSALTFQETTDSLVVGGGRGV